MTASAEKIPVTLLTGFLGSGKTTLLNYILRARHGKRIAIVENEAGDIDIDSDLVVSSDEEIVQMSNGCICCMSSVRSDVLSVIRTLVERGDRLDHILIEASGLADPMPVAQAFFIDDPVLDAVSLDAIVALVDAAHIERHLDGVRHDGINNQVVDQIVGADRIILNKVDLIDDDRVERITRRIRRLNQRSEIVKSCYAEVNLDGILGIRAFELSGRTATDPAFLEAHYVHDHDPAVETLSFKLVGELERSALEAVARSIATEHGRELLRWKGVLAIANNPNRVALQGVHAIYEMHDLGPWPSDHRDSRIVFIGRDLDRAHLARRLEDAVWPGHTG